MKKIALLFVVVLLMSSVAFAGQAYEVSANDVEIVQTADQEINHAIPSIVEKYKRQESSLIATV